MLVQVKAEWWLSKVDPDHIGQSAREGGRGREVLCVFYVVLPVAESHTIVESREVSVWLLCRGADPLTVVS